MGRRRHRGEGTGRGRASSGQRNSEGVAAPSGGGGHRVGGDRCGGTMRKPSPPAAIFGVKPAIAALDGQGRLKRNGKFLGMQEVRKRDSRLG
jgi:hypothetical protein